MANHQSAVKKLRQIKKRTSRNRQVQSKLKTIEKNLSKEIKNKNKENSKKLLTLFMSQIGKASTKGIIRNKRASRKISSFSKKYHRI